jgi:hypothetical protein
VFTYQLEVNEDDGTTTQATIWTPDWYELELGDVFEYEGRALRVWRIEELGSPSEKRLVCDIDDWDAFIAATGEQGAAAATREQTAVATTREESTAAATREQRVADPRGWCLRFDTVSRSEARALGKTLADEGVDVDLGDASKGRVWCFTAAEREARALAERVLHSAAWSVSGPPVVLVWSEEHYRYVDPDAPDEDPDSHQVFGAEFDPADIGWRVRLELSSVWQFGRVRDQLTALGRPEIGNGVRNIDVGASDFADAQQLIARATTLDGVAAATASELSGFQRWRIRERLAGNYAPDGT